jgi:hypothetical protein
MVSANQIYGGTVNNVECIEIYEDIEGRRSSIKVFTDDKSCLDYWN